MYLLDTNHCSLAIHHQPDIIAQLSALGQAQVSTCVIVQAELIYMAENSQNQQNNLQLFDFFLQNIFIYAIDSNTAIYGAFQADLMLLDQKIKINAGELDQLIWESVNMIYGLLQLPCNTI